MTMLTIQLNELFYPLPELVLPTAKNDEDGSPSEISSIVQGISNHDELVCSKDQEVENGQKITNAKDYKSKRGGLKILYPDSLNVSP